MCGVDNLFLSLGHSFASLEYDLSRGPVLPAMLKIISTNLQIFWCDIAYNDSMCFQKLIFPSLRSFPYFCHLFLITDWVEIFQLCHSVIQGQSPQAKSKYSIPLQNNFFPSIFKSDFPNRPLIVDFHSNL